MSRQEPAPASEPLRRTLFRLLRPLVLLGIGFAVGFLAPYLWAVDRWLQYEFGRLSWTEPTRVLARPLPLRVGMPMTADSLLLELRASQYREGGQGPGSYRREGGGFSLHTREFRDGDGVHASRALRLRLAAGRVQSLEAADGAALPTALVDPARIATLYGPDREERRLVNLREAPPLLVAAVQAVEDRNFKHHVGIDFVGIVRALFSNLRAGEVRQGASTLTQQLVRNLYLSREQTWGRKLREAAYSLVIEARFSKSRILEAYLNQVYLGQQGNRAVHGVGAGAEFWFGRELDELGTAEIALLVGLIQGPSWHDPRKHPDRATGRRNRVLDQLVETGLLEPEQGSRAKAAPLGVLDHAGIAANSHPAFLELVRRQLATDYPADRLAGAGLTVLTSLAPMAQRSAEAAVRDELAKLDGKAKGVALQAGMVISDTRSGEVLAVVGARASQSGDFNRALDAKRPVGSLLKPFVYLLALAQPERWSLASMVDDAPITLRVSGSQQWSPENADRQSHGRVSLLDALAESYNQATVRLGMEVGVERLSRLIDVLLAVEPEAHPSLLLGAVDLSPLQMTQLYQFLAAQGQLQPLRAVRAVLDPQGRALSRYERELPAADPGDAIASRLITLALQETAKRGTARRLQQEGFAALQPAGKTGTSNDSRDSWFAGWTGDHLAVVWVGDDRNRPTGLFGSTGAMRVWSAALRALPNEALRVDEAGLERAWIAADEEVRTDAECEGAREYAFVAGYTPAEHRGCTLTRLRDWFGIGGH